LCFFAGANSIFTGDQLLTTPHPAVNDDMDMFKTLGLVAQKPFEKKKQPETIATEASQYHDLGERPKWSRPEHKIQRNLAKQQLDK
jgi:biotin synthase